MFGKTLERKTPRELSAVWWIFGLPLCGAFREGKSPEAAACVAVCKLCLIHHAQVERHVGSLLGERSNTSRKDMLRRGKSPERGECEIKLTRIQREEIVKRVIKP